MTPIGDAASVEGLKPCPFCGGEAKLYGPYGWYSQFCISHSCKAFYAGAQDAFKDYPTADYAIAAWNTRTLSTKEAALREALEPFADALGDDDADEPDHTSATLVCGRSCDYSLDLGDFRRARTALSDSGEGR